LTLLKPSRKLTGMREVPGILEYLLSLEFQDCSVRIPNEVGFVKWKKEVTKEVLSLSWNNGEIL